MPQFKIAHIREQGQDIIIIPLDAAFGNKSADDQEAIVSELQAHASGAGLAGTVVPIWESGGRTNFIAPSPWHPFFRSISIYDVMRNINKELSW